MLADRYEGKRLNSPNDLVYRSDGTLYFTDPPFGLPEALRRPGQGAAVQRRLPRRATARCALVTDELEGPNGLAFSPDERYLYVGNWDLERKVVMRYEVDADGALASGEVFYDMTDAAGRGRDRRHQGRRDGQRLRLRPGRRSGSSRPRASAWALLRLPEEPHNLAWGDEDGRTLYVTALTSVYRMRLRSRHPPREPTERRHHEQEPRARHDAARLRAARRERRHAPAVRAPGRRHAWCCMLGRGEHCPRERQHQREMLALPRVVLGRVHQLVTMLPNDLHDVFRLKISTGAHWTYLADEDLEVQRALDIREYTDPHHDNATRAPHADPRARPA